MSVLPYFTSADGSVTIWHGDCREILPTLARVDAVITDPPYGVGIADWDGSVPYDLVQTFHDMTDGPILWFGASPMLQTDLASFPIAPQRVIVWHVPFSLSRVAAHGMFYRWHPVYAWQMPKRHAGPSQDVISIPQDGHNGWFHPGTKPIRLMCLLVGCAPDNGVILDPFMGSGTTLRAAMDLGRRAIGIEIDERYCEVAARRLEQQVLPLGSVA